MANTKAKETKDNEMSLIAIWREVARKQKGLMIGMILLAVMSALLLIFAMTTLRPQSTVVIVGYGDVYGEIAGISGGYRRDSWLNMMAYPVLALIFGVVHNILALRVYRKDGKDAALVLVVATMALIVGVVVVVFRLLGEW